MRLLDRELIRNNLKVYMKSDYNQLSDEELICLYRDGDKEIMDYIMNKYKQLVRMKAHSMFILGGDSDDLIQEGMIGLMKAVIDYDSGRDASFKTFADLCVSRKMYTAIESAKRKKHLPLNTYVSIYADNDESGDSAASELLLNMTETDPEEILIDKESADRLEDRIYDALSPFEQKVLDLRLTGMGYVEIARVLGKDEKSTDNAIGRIKTKVKKIIKNK